ncbi:MAG TPA: flagellar motor switch protein FliG [Bryobacteraceae bacterium]|jgi:flagellar motor switch protein FliG|nr:flagellar motor switch protein FliG [Bryobacteraceae bacterium]
MTTTESTTSKITGPQKAAILIVALGDKIGGELMKQLNEEEVKAVSKAIARLEKVTPSQTEAVLEEFCQMTGAGGGGRGGFEYAKKVLANAFGAEGAKRIAEHLPKGGAKLNKNLESLQKADPNQLSRFIISEHPQTIALILSYLASSQAASLLANLPMPLRSDVILRIAQLDRVSPDVVARVSVVISEKLRSLGEVKMESHGGPRSVAEILNRMDGTMSEEILGSLSDEQPLVDAIRHFMFTFDDLLLIDAMAMKEVVAKVDRKLLVVALKGTSDQLKNQFLQCMSMRGAEMLREDMEAAGPVRIRDVEGAQQQILEVVRQLESEGVLSLKGGGGSEYVV